jgi:hypothetical protein
MQPVRTSFKIVNLLLILTLLGGLVLSACDGGQFSIDLNVGQGGDGGGEGFAANSTLFMLMIVLFVVVVALVVVAGR